MRETTVVRAAFRVISAGSWDASDFGVVDVEVRTRPEDDHFPPRVLVRISERPNKPPILFDADGYTFDGVLLRFRINAKTDRWVFQALH